MRKLKLQVQISVDGFIGGPNGEMDWMTWEWDEKLKDYATELTDNMDTILMGRKMAPEFNAHWTKAAGDPQDPTHEFGKTMMDTPKYVFSKSGATVEGKNTTMVHGDLTAEVNKIKQLPGKDIIVYGGATFVGSLVKAGLIDDFHLFVNPAVLGKGLPIFNTIENTRQLQLVKATGFDCGITVLHYRKAGQ